MVISANSNFNVSIISNNIPLRELPTPDDKIYIVVEFGQNFIIKLEAKNSYEIYGAKLKIDGKYYSHPKQFKNQGHIYGFKLGHGMYKKFVFSKKKDDDDDDNEEENNSEDSNNNTNKNNTSKNKLSQNPLSSVYLKNDKTNSKGKIVVEFYSTYSVNSNCKIKKPSNYIKFKESVRKQNKKMCFDSTCIKEGDILETNNQKRWLDVYEKNKDNKNYVEHFIDFSNIIDVAEINYSDYSSLVLKGILSFKNINHLYMLPDNNFQLALDALDTIISYHKSNIHYSEISDVFFKYTQKHLKHYLKNKSVEDMLASFPLKYKISKEGYVSTISRKDILSSKLYIDTEYYLSKNEKDFLDNKKQHKDCIDICKMCDIVPVNNKEEYFYKSLSNKSITDKSNDNKSRSIKDDISLNKKIINSNTLQTLVHEFDLTKSNDIEDSTTIGNNKQLIKTTKIKDNDISNNKNILSNNSYNYYIKPECYNKNVQDAYLNNYAKKKPLEIINLIDD